MAETDAKDATIRDRLRWPEPLFESIESDQFAAGVALCLDLGTLTQLLYSHPDCKAISQWMDHPPVAEAVRTRMVGLANNYREPGPHPHDAAVVAYFWILANTRRDMAYALAYQLAQTPTLTWAKTIAQEMLIRGIGRPSRPMNTVIGGMSVPGRYGPQHSPLADALENGDEYGAAVVDHVYRRGPGR